MGVDVIFLGHFSKDRNILYGKERDACGGAIYYSSFPVKKMGLGVAVITKIAKEDSYLLDEFRKEGIEVYAGISQRTTSFKNVYQTLDDRHQEVDAVADPFSINDIPDFDAKLFHVGALISGEVSNEIIEKASKRYDVSLDAQGFMRFLKGNKVKVSNWDEKEKVLKHIKTLKVDSQEARILTNKENVKQAVMELASYGPKEVLLTSDKGVLVYANERFYEAPFKSKIIRGRTGRGDTCIASYISRRLTHSIEDSCKFAAALTSLKMEKPGPFKEEIRSVEKFLKENY